MGVGGWTDNHSIPDQNLYHIIISYMIYNVSQHLKKLHQGRSFGDANAARYLAKIYKESNSTIFFFNVKCSLPSCSSFHCYSSHLRK